jgi:hypothetical protein
MRDTHGEFDGAVLKLMPLSEAASEIAALQAVRELDGVVVLKGHQAVGNRCGLVLAPRCDGEIAPSILSIEVVLDLLAILGKVHELGWVHRDVRTRNVLVHRGSVVLGDFGSAVRAGTMCMRGGTKETASSEVLRSWIAGTARAASTADDVVSTVRMVFFLLHQFRYEEFRKLAGGIAAQVQFWDTMRREYPWFAQWEDCAGVSTASAAAYISGPGRDRI